MTQSQEEIIKILQNQWPNIILTSPCQSAHTKVDFKCLNCGYEWNTTFYSTLHSKCGCPNCGVKEAFRKRSIEYVKSKLSDQFELVEYKDPMHISVKCKDCGNIRTTTTSNLRRYGCKACSSKRAGQNCAKSQEQFIEEATKIHNNKYDYSKVEYTNCHTKVCIICPEHGEFWQAPLKHICSQHGCPKCAGYGTTLNDFLLAAKETFGDFYNYDKVIYKNLVTPVTVTCPIHGDFRSFHKII